MNQIQAPFTPEQVDHLNRFQVGVQSLLHGHPFTCAHRDAGITHDKNGLSNTTHATHGTEGGDLGVLIATEAGLVCPYCGHTQNWAHDFMASPPSVGSEQILERSLQSSGVDTSLLLREKVDALIEAYSALRVSRKISIHQSDKENANTRRMWDVTSVMLASLRRRKMATMGVHINANKEICAIESKWIDFQTQKPKDDQFIYVLYQDQPVNQQSPFSGRTSTLGGISNPGHIGFGCNAWIGTAWNGASPFENDLGGVATHWRPGHQK